MRISALVLCAIMALTSACSGGFKLPQISIPTNSYIATVCATGFVQVDCFTLGTAVKIPKEGVDIAKLVVAVAGPSLAKAANLESCKFEAYPAIESDVLTVHATGFCSFDLIEVKEEVTIKLVPVDPAS